MDACKWLEQVKKLDELIEAKQAEKEQLWALITRTTSNNDGMPHGTGDVSDPIGNIVPKLLATNEDLDRLIDEYIQHKETVIKTLQQLPPKEYGALHRHYIRYMTWEEAAEDMGVCYMSIMRYRKKGLKILEVLLNVI